jgi:hypothetical protein
MVKAHPAAPRSPPPHSVPAGQNSHHVGQLQPQPVSDCNFGRNLEAMTGQNGFDQRNLFCTGSTINAVLQKKQKTDLIQLSTLKLSPPCKTITWTKPSPKPLLKASKRAQLTLLPNAATPQPHKI